MFGKSGSKRFIGLSRVSSVHQWPKCWLKSSLAILSIRFLLFILFYLFIYIFNLILFYFIFFFGGGGLKKILWQVADSYESIILSDIMAPFTNSNKLPILFPSLPDDNSPALPRNYARRQRRHIVHISITIVSEMNLWPCFVSIEADSPSFARYIYMCTGFVFYFTLARLPCTCAIKSFCCVFQLNFDWFKHIFMYFWTKSSLENKMITHKIREPS